jgi:hypothetical protein
MTKGTFWLEERPGGGVTIGIEDYNVESLGGSDYEWSYTLDCRNRIKMTRILSMSQAGSLEQMIAAEFGRHLDKKSIRLWLNANGIEYEFFSWVS